MLKILLIAFLIIAALAAIVTLVERFKTFFVILAILLVVGLILYMLLKTRKAKTKRKNNNTPFNAYRAVMKRQTPKARLTAYTEVDYSGSNWGGYSPPEKISRGNISILSDEEMHVFLKHYYKADEIKTKVKGVSFRNDDGTDRQNILAHCHAGDQLRFKKYEYNGSPAYAVYCDWGQIGNLSAELAEEIAAREKPCIILGEILNVSGGYQGDYFGCNISLTIYEKH